MKKNTRKILLSVYRTDPAPYQVPRSYFELLLPELTPSGLRSMLFQVEEQGYLSSFDGQHGKHWSLTNQGQQIVESLFPALVPKVEAWHLLVFIKPPKTDPSFRYLRALLVKNNWVSISRGCYLWYGQVDPLIHRECLVSYAQSALIVQVGKWQIGDGEQLLLNSDVVKSTLATYSGVSRELSQLIGSNTGLEAMTDQQKGQYALVFDRFQDNLRQDFGFCDRWYDSFSRPMLLLRHFQSVIR